MAWRVGRSVDWRTLVAGIDPGLTRLRLASIAVLAMAVAAGVTELLRVTLAPTEPVTVLLFAGVVAMISNLAVNETDLARQRATTALLALPAVAATAAGTLLVPYRIVADVVFVLVMVAAVYVRRFGPRGFALGQIAFMTFFFTQFLRAQVSQLPWLVVAVLLGLAATLLLRGVVFAERRERTLRRLVAAFRARAHGLIGAVDAVLAELVETPTAGGGVDEAVLDRMRRARARLNDVALQVENELEQATAGRVWPGLANETLALRIFDAELALERLAVSTRRLVQAPEGSGVDQRPDAGAVAALRVGLAHLRDALASRTGHDDVLTAVDDARGAVAGLVALTEPGRERLQRTAFAVRRLADAVHHAQQDAPSRAREPATLGSRVSRCGRAPPPTTRTPTTCITSPPGPPSPPTPTPTPTAMSPRTPTPPTARATRASRSPAARPCRSAWPRHWPSWAASCWRPRGGTGR